MSQIISLSFDNTPVSFNSNGYLNATSIAAKFNKRAADYLRSQSTKDYIAAITRKCVMKENQLVTVKKGGNVQESGTWLHNKLAIDFARWLNPDFAVWCDEQLEAILHPQPQLAATELASDVQRLHLSDLVKYEALKRGGARNDYSSTWNEVKHIAGFSKLENLTPRAYLTAMKYFEVKPIGINPDDWQHTSKATLPAPIPDGMMLIPKLLDDEYWWKGKVHEINRVVDRGKFKSRMIHFKSEQCILMPFNVNIDRDFIVRVRNGVVRRYEQMLSQMAHESEGWRLE